METLSDMFALYITKDQTASIYAIEKTDAEKVMNNKNMAANQPAMVEAYRVKDYSVINGHLKNYSLESDEPELIDFWNLEQFKPTY